MKELLKKGSTLVLLGTGGVGKTTVAAALGLAAAACHLETAVITVDEIGRSRLHRSGLGLHRANARQQSPYGEKRDPHIICFPASHRF